MTISLYKSVFHAVLPALVLATVACGQPHVTANDNRPDIRASSVVPENKSVSVIIDVPSLVGMPKRDIDELWGTPTCPPRNACDYGAGKEVFYVEDKAANFTLPPTKDLGTYGLSSAEPDFKNDLDGVRRWNTKIKGRAAEVSQFDDYTYVKTEEP